jgi:hypothetical protein
VRYDYLIDGVTFNKVTMNDSFWNPRVEINRTVTIPASFRKFEETGRMWQQAFHWTANYSFI